jgi:iron complex outermembrane receptor protein
LNYQVTPSVLVYAKTSKGFRSGGQNLRASGVAGSAFVPFMPEIAREEEVGFKGEFFNRRLRVNVAAFYNEVSDIQRSTLVTTVISGVTSTSTNLGNAGKARFYGGEAEVTARLFPGVTVSATGALIRPKYLQFADATGDRRDEVFQGVPKETFSIAGDYEADLGLGRGLFHADYAWQSRTPLQPYHLVPKTGETQAVLNSLQSVLDRRPGGQLNVRAALLMTNGLEIAVFGRNVLNFRTRDTGILFNAPLNVAASQRNDPATYGVTATFRFGQ